MEIKNVFYRLPQPASADELTDDVVQQVKDIVDRVQTKSNIGLQFIYSPSCEFTADLISELIAAYPQTFVVGSYDIPDISNQGDVKYWRIWKRDLDQDTKIDEYIENGLPVEIALQLKYIPVATLDEKWDSYPYKDYTRYVFKPVKDENGSIKTMLTDDAEELTDALQAEVPYTNGIDACVAAEEKSINIKFDAQKISYCINQPEDHGDDLTLDNIDMYFAEDFFANNPQVFDDCVTCTNPIYT